MAEDGTIDDLEIHTYINCRKCVERRQTQRLEAGISKTGVVVNCKKHGIVVHVSPRHLALQLSRGPQCSCCPGGMHRS